jgi:acetamidase/formamidase
LQIKTRHRRSIGGLATLAIALTIGAGLEYQRLAGAAQTAASSAESSTKQREALRQRRPDHFLGSRPEHLTLGGFPIDVPPAVTMKSGETIRIDVISQTGNNASVDPVTYFGQFGVAPEEVLQDAKDWWAIRSTKISYGPHILTGPVYIEDAEPGDTLEIQILDLNPRVSYGINNTSPTGGVFGTSYPGFRDGDTGLDIPAPPPDAIGGVFPGVRQHLYRIGTVRGRDVAFFSNTINVPLQPFMGVMGLAPATGVFVGSTADAPPPATGVQSSTPPGPFGGNMDNRLLTIGSTLYLPVFQNGGQFYTGDSHAVQGDGEVSGTAIEHSLSGLFRFVLHKGKTIQWPRAENDDYYIFMGIDQDLNRAMRISTMEVIKFLVEEKGLTQAEAFSLASIGIDFAVSEVVDGTQVVSGKVAKSLFAKAPSH